MVNQEKFEKAKRYYILSEEKKEIAAFCFQKGMYKQMISQDYYHIFNLCRIIYSLEYTDTSSHKTLLGNFNKNFIHEKRVFDKTIGSFLNTLGKQRGLCDYEANYPMDKEFAIYLHEQTQIVGQTLIQYISQHFPLLVLSDKSLEQNKNSKSTNQDLLISNLNNSNEIEPEYEH